MLERSWNFYSEPVHFSCQCGNIMQRPNTNGITTLHSHCLTQYRTELYSGRWPQHYQAMNNLIPSPRWFLSILSIFSWSVFLGNLLYHSLGLQIIWRDSPKGWHCTCILSSVSLNQDRPELIHSLSQVSSKIPDIQIFKSRINNPQFWSFNGPRYFSYSVIDDSSLCFRIE